MSHNHAAWRHQHRDSTCDTCRALYNQRARERKRRRYAERVWREGRWVAERADLPHGSPSTYVNWGCRCKPCSSAKAAEQVWYAERAA